MNETMEEEMSSMCNLGEAIARRSLEKGRAEGEMAGGIKMLSGLVRDHVISMNEAAKRMNMSIAEFSEKTGLPLPQ